jgi:hypothetical protein
MTRRRRTPRAAEERPAAAGSVRHVLTTQTLLGPGDDHLADRVQGGRAEGEAHAPLGAELVDEQRVLGALLVREEERAGPPGLTTRSVISVISRCGSTSAETRTSSPSRSSSAIQSRRSRGGAKAGSV